jgi:DNA-binding CsgD family transcriptional regulator
MHQLNCQGARALSKLLLDVYEPVGLEEYRQRMLISIGRAIGNEVVCHNEINGPGGASLSVLRPTVDKFEPLRAVFFEHAHEHPSLAHLIRTGDTNAVKTSDFVSQNEFRRRGIYQEFYRHLRVRYQLTFGFTTDTGALGFVAVSRWHKDFTEEERSVLSLFRPHFIQAYHRAAALNQAGKNGARTREDRTPPQLSRRELEVLHWIAEGKGNEEIAQILGVSLPTVKTHVSHLFGKLGVETRTGAFRRALDLGLIHESRGGP